jgi:hypothetical protein
MTRRCNLKHRIDGSRLDAIEASRRDAGCWGINRRTPDDLVVEIYYGYEVARTLAY